MMPRNTQNLRLISTLKIRYYILEVISILMIFISPCVETRIDTFIDESGRVVLPITRQTFWSKKICLIRKNWLNVLFGH